MKRFGYLAFGAVLAATVAFVMAATLPPYYNMLNDPTTKHVVGPTNFWAAQPSDSTFVSAVSTVVGPIVNPRTNWSVVNITNAGTAAYYNYGDFYPSSNPQQFIPQSAISGAVFTNHNFNVDDNGNVKLFSITNTIGNYYVASDGTVGFGNTFVQGIITNLSVDDDNPNMVFMSAEGDAKWMVSPNSIIGYDSGVAAIQLNAVGDEVLNGSLSVGNGIAGNGVLITNLSGTNILTSSINSNKFDVGTRNQLALAGTITGAIANNAGKGTNNAFTTPTMTNGVTVDSYSHLAMMVTNTAGTYGPIGTLDISGIATVSGTTNNGFQVLFSQNPGDAAYGSFLLNDAHSFPPSPANSEWQFPIPGNLAIAPGYFAGPNHIQWGGGTSGGTTNATWWSGTRICGVYPYGNLNWFNAGVLSATNWGYGPYWGYVAEGWASGQLNLRFPGVWAQWSSSQGTYGLYELDLATEFGNTGNGTSLSDVWNPSTVTHQVRLFGGDHQGELHIGGYLFDVGKSTAGSSAVTLDFSDHGMGDIDVSSQSTITLATTNTMVNYTNATGSLILSNSGFGDKKTFYLRAKGSSVTPTYPGNWNTNGDALPSTIPVGTFLRLELEMLGSGGETNVTCLSAKIYKDQTFFYDPSVTYLLNRIAPSPNQVSLSMSNALNAFVFTLKTAGTWQKLDGLWPVCFNAPSNTVNAITNTLTLVQHGTITNDASGIQGDGSTGYFDTGWRSTTNQNAGAMFLYTKTDGGTGGSFWACGAYDGSTNATGIRHNGSTVWGTFFNSALGGSGAVVAGYSFPDSVMVSRTASTGVGSLNVYAGAGTGSANDTSGTPPPLNSYLLALNNNGNPGGYWSGKVQGFAVSHQTLTQADYSALRSAFQALNSALSR